MSFKTHNEGGIWTGGGAEVPNCTPVEINAIREAFRYCHDVIIPRIRAVRGLEDLANRISQMTEPIILLDCRGSVCDANTAARINARGGREITLCSKALPPAPQQSIDVALFHQLILACNGTEFDAWALENFFYHGHGTVAPDSNPEIIQNNVFIESTTPVENDKNKRISEFLFWRVNDSKVFVKHQMGGTWNTPPVYTEGQQLNIDLTYIDHGYHYVLL